MEIREVITGLIKTVFITEVEDMDFSLLTKKRYSFSWKELKGKAKLYKLQIVGDDDILGVIGLIDISEEKRIEIKLLASSLENIGKNKIYEGIIGCLIAYACKVAKMKYSYWACVSLVPKTLLKAHYIKKYKMIDAGWQLYLEGKLLNDIIIKYSA